MAGVEDAAAILGLVSISVKLSQKIIDISVKYKSSRSQIEAFGKDVQTFGEVLNQLHRLLLYRGTKIDSEVHGVITRAVQQCDTLFSEIDSFKEKLYSKASPSSPLQISFRGKTKWVFEAEELQVLQARLDSSRMNILLLMTLECLQKDPSPVNSSITEENAQYIRTLASQSKDYVQRLQTIEERLMILEDDTDAGADRDSIARSDTASLARSTRDSIISFYGRDSFLQKILEPQESDAMAATSFIDEQRFSNLIEDHLADPSDDSNSWIKTPTSTLVPSSAGREDIKTPSDSSFMPSAEDSVPRLNSNQAAWLHKGTSSSSKNSPAFPSRARALRWHKASNSNTNELNIRRGEIFHVSATNSKYWSAMNSDGQIGLIRARYLVLQDDDSSSEEKSDNSEQEDVVHKSMKGPRKPLTVSEDPELTRAIPSPSPQTSLLASKDTKFGGRSRNEQTSPDWPLHGYTQSAGESEHRDIQQSRNLLSPNDVATTNIQNDEERSPIPRLRDRGTEPVRKHRPQPLLLGASNAQQTTPSYLNKPMPQTPDSTSKRSPGSPALLPPQLEPRDGTSREAAKSSWPLPSPYGGGRLVDQIKSPKTRSPNTRSNKTLHMEADDETSDVLPKYLRKYKIRGDWRNYSLWIVKDDDKRCLGLKEKPLKVFNSMQDLPGRSPMFMLEKNPSPTAEHQSHHGQLHPDADTSSAH